MGSLARPVIGALLVFPMLSATNLGAQTSAPAASSPAPEHCFRTGNRVIRGVGGATIGAWLGFMVAKIRMSDWNDGSHTASATRARNTSTIVGAALGGLAGVLAPHRSCGAPRTQRTAPTRLPILEAEIKRSGLSGTVYDAVYLLRRNWLNDRGVDDMWETPHYVTENDRDVLVPGEPRLMVYLDNARLGTVSELRNLTINGVLAIRYYDPTQANLRWGVGNTHGVIQVVTVLEP